MVSIDIIIPTVVGIGVGLILSFLFTKYGTSVNPYNIDVFGINSNSLITGTLLFSIVCGIVVLAALSEIVRDTEFIVKNPIKFIIELLLMGILPALALLFVMYSRTKSVTLIDKYTIALLISKFSILHLLLQISGYYRYAIV